MAGHSKFKNIMHRKGAQDKKRSGMFSKLSREITVAAKMGLPDPDMNPRLRAAVNAAKAQSMPKDNIQRSIDKASRGDMEAYEEIRYEGFGPGGVSLIIEALTDNRNRTATNVRTAVAAAKAASLPKDNIQRSIDKASRGDAENYEEIRYEGFGPGGVSLIIEALTDNRNRTATNVRTAVAKNGGNLGASGSVSHAFDRMGLITFPAAAGDAEKVFEAALEAGAEDVSSTEDGHEVWTAQGDLHEVAKALEPVLGEAEGAKLAWRPQTMVDVNEDDAATLFKLIDVLDDDDDVQTVWGNYEVSDDVMEKLG